jgi:HSP20 family molecular chaperone IbpA
MNYTVYNLANLFEDLVFGDLYTSTTPNKTKEVLCKSDKPYDIFTNEKTGEVSFGFAIPKMTKDNVKVNYKDSYFTITFTELEQDEKITYKVQGISTKESKATFYVDTDKYDISKEKVKVVVKNGYLTITIPVKENFFTNVDYDIQ